MNLKSMQTLGDSNVESSISALGIVRPAQKTFFKKEVAATLTLTSLVDCFTVILAYLLLASSFGGESMDIPKNMTLPQAYHSTVLESGVIVRVDHGQYFLDNHTITIDKLAEALKAAKEKMKTPYVVIQADKTTNFSQINPAVLSGLQAGFEQVRFAVLQEDEG